MSDCTRFTSGLEPTLAELSRVASRLQDDWWVIGSAAIALTGIEIEVLDVDLLVSERDARALIAGWASPGPAMDGHPRFRAIGGSHTATPIPVRIIGRLEVEMDDRWVPVAPTTRERIGLADGPIYIPDSTDQLALLLMFRRPQDLVRAEVLMRGPGR